MKIDEFLYISKGNLLESKLLKMDKRKRTNEFSKKLNEMILGRKRPRLVSSDVTVTDSGTSTNISSSNNNNDFIPNVNSRKIEGICKFAI